MSRALAVAALAATIALVGCTAPAGITIPDAAPPADTSGPAFPLVDAGASGMFVADGDDWSMPEWARPASNSGFFSEEATPADHVDVRSIDVSWRQLQPTDGDLDLDAAGEAQGMTFESLRTQLADPSSYWMRIFASGEDWAPEWIAEECGVSTYGPDYDGERHLPIWNECVWDHLMDTYRRLFVDAGLAADPRLRFVYVPGAFTWAEFDYEMITAAVDTGDLDFETYAAWYSHAWTDLADLFGEHANKLVFTGEDYPFGPFGADDDLLAADAVAAGLGIRTGITELANFHLSEAPAYGSSIQPNGHLVVDESLPVHDGTRVLATENECYNDCDYTTDDAYYSVRQSNLKALQLRMNWIYVVPGPSFLAEYPEHWDWVRLSMGQTAETSPDAWAALRDAEDRYWVDNDLGRFEDPAAWPGIPFVRNLERWLVQVDVAGSIAHRTDVDPHLEDIEPDNGDAFEGLSTSIADGDTGLAFELDPTFGGLGASALIKVTFLDVGTEPFDVAGTSVPRADTGAWRTATVAVDALPAEFRIGVASQDLVVRFVRVVRLSP